MKSRLTLAIIAATMATHAHAAVIWTAQNTTYNTSSSQFFTLGNAGNTSFKDEVLASGTDRYYVQYTVTMTSTPNDNSPILSGAITNGSLTGYDGQNLDKSTSNVGFSTSSSAGNKFKTISSNSTYKLTNSLGQELTATWGVSYLYNIEVVMGTTYIDQNHQLQRQNNGTYKVSVSQLDGNGNVVPNGVYSYNSGVNAGSVYSEGAFGQLVFHSSKSGMTASFQNVTVSTTLVPEPTALSLAGIGLGLAVLGSRRRRR
jgi:hypothetical protein